MNFKNRNEKNKIYVALSGGADSTALLLQMIDRRNSGSEASAGCGEVATGCGEVATGCGKIATGCGKVATGYGEVAMSCGEVATGCGEVAMGCGEIATGCGEVATGCGEVSADCGEVATGCGEVATGCGKIATGCGKVSVDYNGKTGCNGKTYCINQETEIIAIHINHNIRENAVRDEMFCRKLCEKLGIQLIVKSVNVPAYAKEKKISTEVAARELRYRAFGEICGECVLATAHTASDNAETVLLNLVRGTGFKGLMGIPPQNGNIIRPLLGMTRTKILEYLQSKNQDYITDESNFSLDYTRNKIRLEIIPKLKEINPEFEKTIARCICNLKIDSDYLENSADEAILRCENPASDFQIGRKTILKNVITYSNLPRYDDAILSRIIRKILFKNSFKVNSRQIAGIINVIRHDGKFNISDGIYAVCKKGKLCIQILSDIPIRRRGQK
jgi:tRNA(Ile)-lysidine synthetase-like protein